MKKQLEKIVAIMMSVMMLVCVIPGVTAEAVTQSYVSSQLDSLIRQYANTTATSSQMYNGIQCKGFANWVFKKLFDVYIGAYPESANYKITNAGAQLIGMIEPGSLTESTSRELLQKAKPGDYIQVQRSIAKSGGKCGPHSMIVVDVKAGGVQVFDCNSDRRNTIKNYLYTWSKFDYDNRAMSLYHAYDYQESYTVADSEPPVIEKVWVTDKNKDGYTVNCIVTDNVAVDRVQFPTWTEANDQDDIQRNWKTSGAASGTKSGSNTYTYRVSISDHNNEDGRYFTHVYAYDTSGNESIKGTTSAFIDTTSPFIENVKVTDITKKGYTISCTAVDNVGIDRVLFPTWTAKGGKDDIQKNWATTSVARGTKSGNTYTYKVNVSDHNNEGGIYYTEIHAYDESGNVKTYCKETTVKVRAAYYGDLDKDGEVTVTDVAAVNQAVAGKIKLSAEEKKRADVDEDGKVTEKDGQLIMDYVLEEISRFPVEVYFGDVNMDGEVSISDSGLVTRAIIGDATLSAEAKRRADVNGDGKINSKDTQLIREYIVENIDKFPAAYYGDVNMDRKVNSGDASMVLQAVAGKKTLSAEQKKRADVDGDAKITKKDAQLIMQYDVELIDEFPIEG